MAIQCTYLISLYRLCPSPAPAVDRRGALDCPGRLVNRNTRGAFKECDKAELLRRRGLDVWRSITDGTALSRPELLNAWLLLTFAVRGNGYGNSLPPPGLPVL